MTKGQRIKLRREELNIKQTELAEKVHISKQTLYKYENDIITNIPSNKLEEIATALDTTPDFLMGWQDVKILHDDNVMIFSDKETKERVEKFCSLYESVTPEVQSAVMLILKSALPPSEFPQNS